MYICALHSRISWSLSLLPNRHVTASETDVQLKEEVLFMPGISNYGPSADFFVALEHSYKIKYLEIRTTLEGF